VGSRIVEVTSGSMSDEADDDGKSWVDELGGDSGVEDSTGREEEELGVGVGDVGEDAVPVEMVSEEVVVFSGASDSSSPFELELELDVEKASLDERVGLSSLSVVEVCSRVDDTVVDVS